MEYFQEEDALKYATKRFGPFMKEWRYKFPDGKEIRISKINVALYRIFKSIKKIYSRLVAAGFLVILDCIPF